VPRVGTRRLAVNGSRLALSALQLTRDESEGTALRVATSEEIVREGNCVTDFDVILLDDRHSAQVNGAIRRRVCLRIDGEDVDVVTVRLDSDVSRTRQSTRWADKFGVNAEDVEDKLRRTCVIVAAEAQERPTAPDPATRAPGVSATTLDEARPIYAKWIADLDHDLLDVVFGAIIAHRLDGDPVWVFIIGAPGDAKTEIIRSTSASAETFLISSLTPRALISGYENDDGSDPSLLPRLDGKVLCIKDFTCILTLPNDARAEILGTLRDAYDGEAVKAFGMGEIKRYRSRFGLLAAVTPVLESYWGVSAQLGERFLRFRLQGDARVAKVRRAMVNTNGESAMRAELSDAALAVLAQTPLPPTVAAELEERLIHLADFVSRARSEVCRDRQGVVQYLPGIEVGTRCGKALKKLAMGIAMARGVGAVDGDVYRIVLRVALDTVPSMRAALLRVLWIARDGDVPTSELADACETPTDTARTWLEDLRLLGIVDRVMVAKNAHSWKLKDSFEATTIACGVSDVLGAQSQSPPYVFTNNSTGAINSSILPTPGGHSAPYGQGELCSVKGAGGDSAPDAPGVPF
jgi:predicted ArsR family transcriptional regulator